MRKRLNQPGRLVVERLNAPLRCSRAKAPTDRSSNHGLLWHADGIAIRDFNKPQAILRRVSIVGTRK